MVHLTGFNLWARWSFRGACVAGASYLVSRNSRAVADACSATICDIAGKTIGECFDKMNVTRCFSILDLPQGICLAPLVPYVEKSGLITAYVAGAAALPFFAFVGTFVVLERSALVGLFVNRPAFQAVEEELPTAAGG